MMLKDILRNPQNHFDEIRLQIKWGNFLVTVRARFICFNFCEYLLK